MPGSAADIGTFGQQMTSNSPAKPRILVMDDEALIREVLGEMLTRLGFTEDFLGIEDFGFPNLSRIRTVTLPTLIIHGNADSNPGTLTFQSEVFFEAVRGSGGTARLVLLPFEDHGYRSRESVEHVLWEQLEWFDAYVKNAE